MLKVLGSFRLTFALIGVAAFIFIANPLFQPPTATPVKTGNGNGRTVLATVTSIPEQANAAPAASQTTVIDSADTLTTPTSETMRTVAPPASSVGQTQQSNLQPIVQQVAAPVTQPVKTVVNAVTKPICVNTKLLTLKLDTCLHI